MPSYSAALIASLALGGLPLALACNGSNSMPTPSGIFSNTEPIEVGEGEVFDGEMALYDRGSGACNEQEEGGESDTVFILRPGATLRNVIIGKDQAEGIYCIGGGCTIENVWFEDVCEDAISIKEDPAGAVTNIIGGGAFSASDKIIQHNGCGTVNIQDFYAQDYGKVYRSCGTCEMCKRTVVASGITASGGGEIVGINIESGDEATLENICTDHEPACQLYDGPGDKAGEC